jgi:hypothetical protein
MAEELPATSQATVALFPEGRHQSFHNADFKTANNMSTGPTINVHVLNPTPPYFNQGYSRSKPLPDNSTPKHRRCRFGQQVFRFFLPPERRNPTVHPNVTADPLHPAVPVVQVEQATDNEINPTHQDRVGVVEENTEALLPSAASEQFSVVCRLLPRSPTVEPKD